ncbi:MAG TPA: LPS assembly protein LptD [Verrucomicrobiae bacterium]|nr:LPS assembly protein LptD [Verrucomicrobiae bacterium]
MAKLRILTPLALLILFQVRPLFAAQAPRAGEPAPEQQIHVTADSLSASDGGKEIEGQGNVELHREEMTLKADQVRMNRETKDMEAIGNVSVDDPDWKVKQAQRMQFNLDNETGMIENGDLFLEKGHLTMSGSRIQKLEGQAYHLDEGIFTTCLCDSGPPTWKISADQIDLTREGSGVIRRGTFYIMDVPVFYIPYGLFPVNTERQTGFLFPEFGTSSKSGFRYMQPFYWAIDKSSDLTLTTDIETRARLGLMGEYRKVFSKDTKGEIELSYFNELFRTNADSAIKDRTISGCHNVLKASGDISTDCDVIPVQRWSATGTFRQMGTDWTTYSDLALFSDDFFVRELTRNMRLDFDRERDIKTMRYSLSRVGFLRGWDNATLQGEFDYYQDFIQPDSRTLHRTPELLFTGRQALWNTPLELRWRADGINYISAASADGLRVDLRPELVLPFNFANYLHGAFSVAPRETLYHLYDDSTKTKTVVCVPTPSIVCFPSSTKRSFDRNNSRELVEVNGNIGTSFERVFSLSGGDLQKIKHVLEPEMGYVFVSRTKQSDIPIMDSVDRVNYRNLLTFSLTNRFWGKYSSLVPQTLENRDVETTQTPIEGDTRELARFKAAMNYSVARDAPSGGRLSDIDLNLRLMPKDYMAFGGGTGINPSDGKLSEAVALFSIFDPRPITHRVLDQDFMRPNSLDLSYRFIDKTANSPLAENANPVLVDPSSTVKVCSSIKTLSGNTFDPRCQRTDVLGLVSVRSLFHVTDHLLFLYDATYNARRGGFSTNRGAVKILSQCECWALTLALNHSTNPNETNFRFNFELLGLSSQSKPAFK